MMRVMAVAFVALLLVPDSGGAQSAGRDAAALRLLAAEGFGWVTVETPVARIDFQEGSYAESQRESLAAPVAEARRAVLAFERHELTHLVAFRASGAPGEPAAASLEGTVVYVDGRCGGRPIGEVARRLELDGKMVAWNGLIEEFRTQDDLVAYLQAGSMIEYIAELRGLPFVRRVWRQGLAVAPALLETDAATFEAEWRAWLADRWDPGSPELLGRVRAGGCGVRG